MAELNFVEGLWRVNVPGLTDEEGVQVMAQALNASRIYRDNKGLLQAVGQDVSQHITRFAQEALAAKGRLPAEPVAAGLHLEPPVSPPLTLEVRIEAMPKEGGFNVYLNGQKVMPNA